MVVEEIIYRKGGKEIRIQKKKYNGKETRADK
jgi:hypothetical protein